MGEKGRSLTEMLGVLAIIGVLSITAIFGYGYAMNKYRANETIKELSERAILAAAQMAFQQSVSQDEMGPSTRQGYPVKTIIYVDDPQFFDITLSNVPQGVCKQILKSEYKSPVKIEVDGKWYRNDASVCSDSSEMVFIFDKDLDAAVKPPRYCERDSECSGCDVCVDNMCTTSCTGTNKCARDFETGFDTCCAPDKYADGLCCPSTLSGLCCNSSGQCCPTNRPLVDKNGTCHACNATYSIDVGGVTSNCSACPDRIITGSGKDRCMLPCGKGIYKDKPLTNWAGECYSCDHPSPVNQTYLINTCTTSCPNRYAFGLNCNLGKCGTGIYKDKALAGVDGACYSCDIKAAIYTWATNCAACPDRKQVGNVCIKPCGNGYFNAGLIGSGEDKGCYSCDDPNPVSLYLGNKSLCEACPNRAVRTGADWAGWRNLQCIIDCGTGIYKDKPLPDSGAKCFSCTEPKAIHTLNPPDCDICPNRHMEGNKCMLDCPAEKPLADSYGNCFTCTYEDVINVEGRIEACKICPNRVMSAEGNACILPCGQGVFTNKPLEEYTGRCLSCNEKRTILVTQKEACGACPNRKLETNIGGTYNFCSTICPPEKPLQDVNGNCYTCDTDSIVNVRWNATLIDTCRVCSNREISGYNCVKKS